MPALYVPDNQSKLYNTTVVAACILYDCLYRGKEITCPGARDK